ncbi:MAG: hypothetical protein AB1716_20540 [Planctomycetota bacterium]
MLEGTVRNGVIVLDGVTLPEGTRVRVQLADPATEDDGSLAAELLRLAGSCDGPPDLSEHHDHYLYGTPKP